MLGGTAGLAERNDEHSRMVGRLTMIGWDVGWHVRRWISTCIEGSQVDTWGNDRQLSGFEIGLYL